MTRDVKIQPGDGWVEISDKAHIYAHNSGASMGYAAWGVARPSTALKGYPINPSMGISREFEEGRLWMKASGFELILMVDDRD